MEKKLRIERGRLALAALCCMMMGLVSSCSNEDVPIVVTDDKPFTYDQYIDTSVRPGDDFFRYQYGKWLDDSQLPALNEITMKKLGEVETLVADNSNDPAVSAIRELAKATEAADTTGMALLNERIQYLSAIKTQQDLLDAFSQLHQWGYSPLVRMVVYSDERVIRPVLTGELASIYVRSTFQSHDENMLSYNVRAICSALILLGFDRDRIAEISENALEVEKLEMKAYENIFNRIRRLQDVAYRPQSRRAVSQTCMQVCQLMGIGDLSDIMLENDDNEKREVQEQLMNMLLEGSEQSVAQMRDYFIAYVMESDVAYIPKLSPAIKTSDRIKYAMSHAKYHMYHLQVETFGKQNIQKEKCNEIMEEFRSILRERIEHLDWMSSTTKQAAQKKVDNMLFFIGYPDEWNDELTPVVEGTTLLEAVCSLRRQEVGFFCQMAGKSIATNGWDFWCTLNSFTIVNASYDPMSNQLIILPAFLIAPMFDGAQSEAALYGTACVFGHEMCHGFDANGSEHNEVGALYDWWTPEDKAAFEEKQQQLINLWGQLEHYPGQPANGTFTLRENMADYGGVTLAFEAYKRRLQQQGFEGEQFDQQLKKFWLAYGMPVSLVPAERSLEALKASYINDIHSAGHNRVNGIVRLFDEWYRLYDVKPTDKLYLAPEDRVGIW